MTNQNIKLYQQFVRLVKYADEASDGVDRCDNSVIYETIAEEQEKAFELLHRFCVEHPDLKFNV